MIKRIKRGPRDAGGGSVGLQTAGCDRLRCGRAGPEGGWRDGGHQGRQQGLHALPERRLQYMSTFQGRPLSCLFHEVHVLQISEVMRQARSSQTTAKLQGAWPCRTLLSQKIFCLMYVQRHLQDRAVLPHSRVSFNDITAQHSRDRDTFNVMLPLSDRQSVA